MLDILNTLYLNFNIYFICINLYLYFTFIHLNLIFIFINLYFTFIYLNINTNISNTNKYKISYLK